MVLLYRGTTVTILDIRGVETTVAIVMANALVVARTNAMVLMSRSSHLLEVRRYCAIECPPPTYSSIWMPPMHQTKKSGKNHSGIPMAAARAAAMSGPAALMVSCESVSKS